jgi:glyoxylase-like metal-dependent hydrolase (beta-lactamase superfamily II)
MGLYSASRKAFFTSDSIRVANGKLLPPHPKFTADYPMAVRSVGRIAEYDFDTLLPGHGSPVTPDAAKKVRALYEEIKVSAGVK